MPHPNFDIIQFSPGKKEPAMKNIAGFMIACVGDVSYD